MNFLMVALGGALGAVLRYAVSLVPLSSQFPYVTVLTNIIGAIAIGFIVGIMDNNQSNTLLFWKVGVCGGFTTFSTFSLEAVDLLQKQLYFLAIFYVIASVLGSLLGILLGQFLAARIK